MRANTTGATGFRLRPAAALASRQQPRLREAGGAGDSHPYLLPRSRRTSGDRRDHARPAGGASGKAGDPELEYDAASRRGGQRYLAQQRELHLTDRIFALRLSVRSPADSALHPHRLAGRRLPLASREFNPATGASGCWPGNISCR